MAKGLTVATHRAGHRAGRPLRRRTEDSGADGVFLFFCNPWRHEIPSRRRPASGDVFLRPTRTSARRIAPRRGRRAHSRRGEHGRRPSDQPRTNQADPSAQVRPSRCSCELVTARIAPLTLSKIAASCRTPSSTEAWSSATARMPGANPGLPIAASAKNAENAGQVGAEPGREVPSLLRSGPPCTRIHGKRGCGIRPRRRVASQHSMHGLAYLLLGVLADISLRVQGRPQDSHHARVRHPPASLRATHCGGKPPRQVRESQLRTEGSLR